MDKVLNPAVVRVAQGRVAVGPTAVAAQQIARPVADIEGRIGEVHVRQPPRHGVGLLPENGDVGL